MLTGLMFISTGTRDPNWPINGNAVYICYVIIINKKKRRNLVEFAGIDLKPLPELAGLLTILPSSEEAMSIQFTQL